jgi:hypothetical protein
MFYYKYQDIDIYRRDFWSSTCYTEGEYKVQYRVYRKILDTCKTKYSSEHIEYRAYSILRYNKSICREPVFHQQTLS